MSKRTKGKSKVEDDSKQTPDKQNPQQQVEEEEQTKGFKQDEPKKSATKTTKSKPTNTEEIDVIEAVSDEDKQVVAEKKATSVLDFNEGDIRKLNNEKFKEYDTNTLLKVLMVRGKDVQNPTIYDFAKNALLKLNFERPERHDQQEKSPRKGRNDRGGRGRGGFNNNSRGFSSGYGRGGFIKNQDRNYEDDRGHSRYGQDEGQDDGGERSFKPRQYENRPTGGGRGGKYNNKPVVIRDD